MNDNNNILPPWALRLLERLVPYRLRDVVVGDFAEIFYYIAQEDGRFSAIRWYLWQLMRSLPSFVLNGFASRISLSPLSFLLPGLVVLVVALISSGYHVIRAARSNPVDGIRSQ